MDPSTSDASSGGRSAAALRTIIAWTISAVNSRGDFPKLDPNIVLDNSALRRVGKAVAVYSAKPLVNGAVVLLEIFARIILLLIFLALSFSPSRRTVVVNRMRITLESHVNSVRRCATALRASCCARTAVHPSRCRPRPNSHPRASRSPRISRFYWMRARIVMRPCAGWA